MGHARQSGRNPAREPRQRQPTRRSGGQRTSVRDVLVLSSLTVISLAFGFGLLVQAGSGPMLSIIAGLSLFIAMGTLHLVMRRVQSVPILRDRVDDLERRVAEGGRGQAEQRYPQHEPWADADAVAAMRSAASADEFGDTAGATDAGEEQAIDFGVPEVIDDEEPELLPLPRHALRTAADAGNEPEIPVGDLVRQIASELGRVRPAREDGLVASAGASGPQATLPAAQRSQGIDRHEEPRLPDPETAALRRRLEARDIEIHLQPILSLNDRKPRYYEVFPRLRQASGGSIAVADAVAALGATELKPLAERASLLRTVEIVERLLSLGKARPVLLKVSPALLADGTILHLFHEMLRANRVLAEHIVFVLRQDDLETLGAAETDGFATLAQLGFRFAVNAVTRFDVVAKALADARVSLLKVSVEAARTDRAGVAELLAELNSEGLDLVAEDVADLRAVPLLEELKIRLAQGPAFSEPRPLRAEVLAGSKATTAA